MGCSGSAILSQEEKAITYQQKKLKFYRIKSQSLDFTIRKYSTYYTINQNQFKKITSLLQIPTRNSLKSPKTKQFFSFFQTQDKFSFTYLIVLGIMLSKGQPRTKAKLLFQSIDFQQKQAIDSDQFLQILDTMVQLSINFIPRLVPEQGINYLAKSELQNYMYKLYQEKETAKFRLASSLLGKDISKFQVIHKALIVQRLSGESLSELMTPYGIRRFMLDLAEREPNIRNQAEVEAGIQALGGMIQDIAQFLVQQTEKPEEVEEKKSKSSSDQEEN